MSPKIFIVEGNIGSGKTTFLSRINKLLDDCQVIYEPVDEWQKIKDENGKNILDYFYTDMERWCYLFQSMAFITRFQKFKQIDHSKKYVFIERSVFSDKHIFAENCYQQGTMSDIEWKVYSTWFESMKNTIDLPLNFIYLKCPSEVSFERLKIRNRDEEKEVPLEYLKNLEERHENWLGEKEGVVHIDCVPDFKSNDEIMKGHISKILSNK